MKRDTVNEYVKRPVKVEAIQFNGANVDIVRSFTGGKLSAFHRKNNAFYISTDAGMMIVKAEDYIVKGVLGEFYPVKKEVFEFCYEVNNA